MHFFQATRTAVLILSIGLCLHGQDAAPKDAAPETKGLPPRATAADYQTHAQAGTVTLAAEFTGHSIPTAEGPLTNEDYVVVEVALFGPEGAQLRIAASDFSLRLNGKKTPLPSQPYGLVINNVKDPEYVPPDPPAAKGSKTGVSSGGQGQDQQSGPPPPVKIPLPVQRAMAKRVQKSTLAEGDRALPQAGLLYFQQRGKTSNLQSVELIYEGPAGKATLKLHP